MINYEVFVTSHKFQKDRCDIFAIHSANNLYSNVMEFCL